MPEFTHLHLHTDYSLLDGACDVEKLVARAKSLNMPAVAVTDHGNIFGAFFHGGPQMVLVPLVVLWALSRVIAWARSKKGEQ